MPFIQTSNSCFKERIILNRMAGHIKQAITHALNIKIKKNQLNIQPVDISRAFDECWYYLPARYYYIHFGILPGHWFLMTSFQIKEAKTKSTNRRLSFSLCDQRVEVFFNFLFTCRWAFIWHEALNLTRLSTRNGSFPSSRSIGLHITGFRLISWDFLKSFM